MAVAEFVYVISIGVAVACIIFGGLASFFFLVNILEGTDVFFPSESYNTNRTLIKRFLASAAVLLFGIAIVVVHCKYMNLNTYTNDNYYLDQMIEEYDPTQVQVPSNGVSWDEPSLVEVTMFNNTYWYMYQPGPSPTPTPVPHQEFARDV